MRNSKIVALVATAALLVLGAAFTSFAATYTWYQVDGIWHCKDKSGDDYTDAWAKSGNDMYYLDENGEMATSMLIDDGTDLFYVDEDGKMVKNDWRKVEKSDDDDEDADDYSWYFFQGNGKAKRAKAENKPVTINGKKYMFGADGKMLYGWIDLGEDTRTFADDDEAWKTATYYAGEADDGAIRTGWQQLDVIDLDADTIEETDWFYFGTNGKKVAAKFADDLVEKAINGKKYAFDVNGKMVAEWGKESSVSTASDVQSYYWFHTVEDGSKLAKGWFRVIPTASVNQTANDDEEQHWFYAKGAGTIAKMEVKTIKGKKYAFNEKGEMMSGLICINVNADNTIANYEAIDTEAAAAKVQAGTFDKKGGKIFFFGDEETDGAMKTGTVKTEIDGDDYTFLFVNTGVNKYAAQDGIKGNSYYVNGAKLCADADVKYEAFTYTLKEGVASLSKLADIESIATTKTPWASVDGKQVLISSSGTIVKNATVKKDADGLKYKVDTYKATKVVD